MRVIVLLLMIVAVPCATACPVFVISAFLRRDPRLALWGFGLGIVANGITAVVSMLEGRPVAAVISALLAAGCALGWWDIWRRRRRDRAPGLAGYKAKAALAKLLRKAREAAQPRPVLRPVPGAAS